MTSETAPRDPFYYVGVHHKTGYVWMKRVHSAISKRLGLPLVELVRSPIASVSISPEAARESDPALNALCQQRRGIVFDRHSTFPELAASIPRIRGMHLVRDPRDVLISATLYHLKSSERWLRRPMPLHGGISYQQKLRSLGTFRESLLFELVHQTRRTVERMAAFPALPHVRTVTYESLMAGDVLGRFESIFASLGLSGDVLAIALECAREESIVLNPERRNLPHVRSGMPGEWRREFDSELGGRFVEEAGSELLALGYESDHSWVEDLPASRPALDQAPSARVPDTEPWRRRP